MKRCPFLEIKKFGYFAAAFGGWLGSSVLQANINSAAIVGFEPNSATFTSYIEGTGLFYVVNLDSPSLEVPAAITQNALTDTPGTCFRLPCVKTYGLNNSNVVIAGYSGFPSHNYTPHAIIYTINPAAPSPLVASAGRSGPEDILSVNSMAVFGPDHDHAAVIGGDLEGDLYLYSLDLTNISWDTAPVSQLSDASNVSGIMAYGSNNSQGAIVGYDTNIDKGFLYLTDLFSPSLVTPAATTTSDDQLTAIALYGNSNAAIVGQNATTDSGILYLTSLNTPSFGASPTASTNDPTIFNSVTIFENDSKLVAVGQDTSSTFGALYITDISSPSFASGPTLTGVACSLQNVVTYGANQSMAAVVGCDDSANPTIGYLYLVDLNNPSLATPAATMALSGGLFGITMLPSSIPTTGLKGNSLKLANLLNANAPYPVVWQLAMQTNTDSALKNIAPTRNVLSTFAAQYTQFQMSQTVIDHLCQSRGMRHSNASFVETAMAEESGGLTASLSRRPQKKVAKCTPKTVSPWLSLFGDYSKENTSHQAPGFHAGSGGVVASCDYLQLASIRPIGVGLAYAHTHLRDQNQMGHSNIDQGALFTYGTINVDNWYFDLTLWGGYYHARNDRKINITGYQGHALSSIHGWQAAPHLEVGYDCWNICSCSWLSLEPFAMGDWVSTWECQSKETHADLFNFGQKERWCSMFRGEGGLRLAESINHSWGKLTIREKISYAYQQAFSTGRISTFLVGSPGLVTLTAFEGAQNLGVIELGLFFAPRNNKYPYGSISYQGEFGGRYLSQQGMASIGMDF